MAPYGRIGAALSVACVVVAGHKSHSQSSALQGEILARMAQYVRHYETELSEVVAEERYEQWITTARTPTNSSTGRVREGAATGPSRRVLVSDFLMVRRPGEEAWLGFRDVMSVDGTPVRDRQERLVRLFIDGPHDVLKRARAISQESARYNIGTVERNINVPTQVLDFLHPRLSDRFAFRSLGNERVNGGVGIRIVFEEKGSPYLIQTPSGHGVRARGMVWIEEVTGAVLQTQLDLMLIESRNRLRLRIDALFRGDPALNIRVPVELRETYEQSDPTGRIGGGLQMHGRAEYSNFRRFRTETRESIK